MINIGDLVNNIDTADYNYGMVLEINLSVTDELIADGASIELADLEAAGSGYEPPATRVLWECGDVNIHYADELEVLGEISHSVE
jgi:hypothetical protein